MTIPEKIARAKELAEKAGGYWSEDRAFIVDSRTLLSAMANDLESEHNRANRAEAEVERLQKLMEWQPIETAPKDGTRIQTWSNKYPKCGVVGTMWSSEYEGWVSSWSGEPEDEFLYPDPTHWLPLPPAPSRVKTEE